GRTMEPDGRSGGSERYLRYCEASRSFMVDFDLAPQEVDAILSVAARVVAEDSAAAADEIAALEAETADDAEAATQTGRPEVPLAQIAATTHLPLEQVEEWVALLNGKKRQALFYGPPGTGKTFVAEQLALHLAGGRGEIELAQFHPSFAYEDFLE